MAGMKSINIEKLMGHSLGMSTNSYYQDQKKEKKQFVFNMKN
jgi:hypothetical protein